MSTPGYHVLVEEERRPGVVGVMVRVDDVGDRVAHAVRRRDLVDGALQVVADGGRSVEEDDAVASGQERRLVDAVGDPVEVSLDASHVVALLVEGGPECRGGNRRVVRQGVADSCHVRGAHRIRPSREDAL
jgi:hypothetical protein